MIRRYLWTGFVVSALLVIAPMGGRQGVLAEDHEQGENHAHEEPHAKGADDTDEHGEKEEQEKETRHEDHEDEEEGHGAGHGSGHEDEHGDHDEHGASSSVGPGKAIIAAEEEGRRFKLSPESEQFIGVEFGDIEPAGTGGAMAVPTKALVTFQERIAIFVNHEGWYELVPAKVLSRSGATARIEAKGVQPGDRVATAALGTLRAANLQASGQGGEGHAH